MGSRELILGGHVSTFSPGLPAFQSSYLFFLLNTYLSVLDSWARSKPQFSNMIIHHPGLGDRMVLWHFLNFNVLFLPLRLQTTYLCRCSMASWMILRIVFVGGEVTAGVAGPPGGSLLTTPPHHRQLGPGSTNAKGFFWGGNHAIYFPDRLEKKRHMTLHSLC